MTGSLADVSAAAPALIQALNDDSYAVRTFHVRRALSALGRDAVPVLLDVLRHGTARERIGSVAALLRIDSAYLSDAVPVIRECLDGTDEAAATDALVLIGDLGRDACRFADDLLRVSRSPATISAQPAWPGTRQTVAIRLSGHLRGTRHVVAPVLVEQLSARDPATRWSAARALGELGGRPVGAAVALARMVTDAGEHGAVRLEAAYSLAVIGRLHGETLPALVEVLRGGDSWMRIFAARIIGEMAAAVRVQPHPLTPWRVRDLRAIRAVRRLRDVTTTLRALLPLLNDPEYDVRRNAAYALSRLGPRAAAAIPSLVGALAREDTGPICAEALAAVGTAAIPALDRAVRDEAPMVARHAAYGLEKAGRTAPRSAPRFEPTIAHFYSHWDTDLTADKQRAFEELFTHSLGGAVTYTLPYPKVEFLRYLVEHKALLLHGTPTRDLEVLRPVRNSIDSRACGNVLGVYADRDAVRPIYFAVLDRERCFGLDNRFVDLDADGQIVRDARPYVDRYYQLSIGTPGLKCEPWRDGWVYALPADTFELWNEWTSRVPVKPVLRVAVTRSDLPVDVCAIDYRQIGNPLVHPTDEYPFLKDTQFTPIRFSGKPPWQS
ncbi:MAG: HEAT repeat domain-containing protein [Vicinamibacterales bacterium]